MSKTSDERPCRRISEAIDNGAAQSVSTEESISTVPVAKTKAKQNHEWLHVVSDEPLRLAEHVIQHCFTNDMDQLTLRFYDDEYWHYNPGSGCYQAQKKSHLQSVIYSLLDRTKFPKLCGNGECVHVPLRPNMKKVAEVIAALPSRGLAADTHPSWADSSNKYSACDILATRTALLHLQTRSVSANTPSFFNMNALDYCFNRQAGTPNRWLSFLHSLWPDDPQSIETLQMWAGYLLMPQAVHQKILLLLGPPRSGKGTIIRTLSELVGSRNSVATSFHGLTSNFGLSPLLNKRLCSIPDARFGGLTASARLTLVERLLSISGQDAVPVDIKHRHPISVRLDARLIVATNELPKLNDASGALVSRFIVLRMRNSFLSREDIALSKNLYSEREAILNWCLDGYDKLASRGKLSQPDSGVGAFETLESLTSPARDFVRDECDLRPNSQVRTAELYESWRRWCCEHQLEAGTQAAFGVQLHAAAPSVDRGQSRTPEGKHYYYRGISLKDAKRGRR